MDSLCNQMTTCYIEHKPKLYNMMIYDFKELSNQYSDNVIEYSFDMKPEYDYIDFHELQELLRYLQKNNVEELVTRMIIERHHGIHIDKRTIQSMIDYYIDCLSNTV